MATIKIISPEPETTVKGTIVVLALLEGDEAQKAALVIDDIQVAEDRSVPYQFDWNSTTVPDGMHTLRVAARSGSKWFKTEVEINVDNVTPVPEPEPEPEPLPPEPDPIPVPVGLRLLYSTKADKSDPKPLTGATLEGSVYVWAEGTTGPVKFYLDNVLVQSETNPPFDLEGGTATAPNPWNTTTVSDGQHNIRAEVL